MGKKSEYVQKTVTFGGKKLVLFSLDGITWSSRKDELRAIMERHEQEKITINDIRGVAEETKDEKEQEEEGADDKAHDILEQEEDDEARTAGKKGRKLRLVADEELEYDEEDDVRPVRKTRIESESKEGKAAKTPAKALSAGKGKTPASAGRKNKAPLALPRKRSSSAPLKRSQTGKARRRAAA